GSRDVAERVSVVVPPAGESPPMVVVVWPVVPPPPPPVCVGSPLPPPPLPVCVGSPLPPPPPVVPSPPYVFCPRSVQGRTLSLADDELSLKSPVIVGFGHPEAVSPGGSGAPGIFFSAAN